MTRQEIIIGLKKYFRIQELVGIDTYKKLRGDAWQVFDTDTLHCLLIIREGLKIPIDINNWFWNGIYDERGFRSNIQPIVKNKTLKDILYLSGHPLGKAFDLQSKEMNAEDIRQWIIDNAELFPCKVRLEWKKKNKDGVYEPITWVHFDTKQIDKLPKIYRFNI